MIDISIVLTHVALRVQSPRKTASFYQKYCNLEIVHQRYEPTDDMVVLWLGNKKKSPNFVLVLMETMPEPSSRGSFHHLGFDVPERVHVDRIAALARQEGVLWMEPQYISEVVGYICMLRDPDGNMVEISYGQMI